MSSRRAEVGSAPAIPRATNTRPSAVTSGRLAWTTRSHSTSGGACGATRNRLALNDASRVSAVSAAAITVSVPGITTPRAVAPARCVNVATGTGAFESPGAAR